MIRIASYNLENLFTRPVAMNQDSDEEGRQAIEDHSTASVIIRKDVYSQEDQETLLALTNRYGWHFLNPPATALVQLQKVRGQLFRKPQGGVVQVAARGRADWVGWFELRREDVAWEATYNTGRVIVETRPDILVAVEVENRPTLNRFIEQVLGPEFGVEYPHFMVIDGNDLRGIDVGILSRYPIEEIRSHVDDRTDGKSTFSRDCPEYDVVLPSGERLVIMPNHFKSKRNGNDQESQERRRQQAERAREIAEGALRRTPYVLIAGDLNDTPTSTPLAPLFTGGFQDVIVHANYPQDRPGTYGTGKADNKIDYLIMSPELRGRLTNTGIERRGSYHPQTWEPFDTVTSTAVEASDHHLLWADFDL